MVYFRVIMLKGVFPAANRNNRAAVRTRNGIK